MRGLACAQKTAYRCKFHDSGHLDAQETIAASFPNRMPGTPRIDCKVGDAHGHATDCQEQHGDVGIDDQADVVQQKTAAIRRQAGTALEKILRHRQWTRPGTNLHGDSPYERGEMERGQPAAARCPECAKDHPQDPAEMQAQHQNHEGVVELRRPHSIIFSCFETALNQCHRRKTRRGVFCRPAAAPATLRRWKVSHKESLV